MTLAPIRGAPPGAPVPDFPIDEPKTKPAEPAASPASAEQYGVPSKRAPQTPIEIAGDGISITFSVSPELPAIARATMTVKVVSGAAGSSSRRTLGFLRMSAAKARALLSDLRNGRSPIVAIGDEDGTVRIEYDITEAGRILSVCKPGESEAMHRLVIDDGFDLTDLIDQLLADLGV